MTLFPITNVTITSESETEKRAGSLDVQMNQEVYRKFQILMEKNETLNEVLEKKYPES